MFHYPTLMAVAGGIILVCLIIIGYLGKFRLKKYQSPLLGSVEVWWRLNGEKSLTINNYTHGISTNVSSITKNYWYTIAEKAVQHCQDKKSPQVLFFGLGANTSSRIIAQKNPQIHQTIIEIDSYIIEACEQFFDLKSLPRYTLIHGDAYDLIDKRKDFTKKFDVVVIDIFTGNPPYVSTRSDKPHFIQKVIDWTKPDGLLIFNRPADNQRAVRDGKILIRNLRSVLDNVQVTLVQAPRGLKNNIITGMPLKRSKA